MIVYLLDLPHSGHENFGWGYNWGIKANVENNSSSTARRRGKNPLFPKILYFRCLPVDSADATTIKVFFSYKSAR